MKWKLYKCQHDKLDFVAEGDEVQALKEQANKLAEKAGFWDHVWVSDPDGQITTHELYDGDKPERLFIVRA